MAAEWCFARSSLVPAATDEVWRRVVSPAGINDEMWPWIRMTVPCGAGEVGIDAVPLGEPLGRAWLLLFGALPFDYDLLTITAVEPGRRFREQSTMLSMRTWVHERTLEPAPDGGTLLTDQVTLVPRGPLVHAGPMLRTLLSAFFGHRHRRLVRYFAARGSGSC
ncbi:hypothetical protein AD006_29590 (plasmid) [Pseudonocardia sp. EC080610-09]|uniref:hypothetical protein n=1 Tax=unclassified Pseudonocardia TaxID=2619320 RepID=UPI000705EDE0|nr:MULTISPECIES: hypothetical protein [unclassified Pseudonocardia]ALL79421.1 hypothetical protein AD006_29590 [Pseudonocardia sp. EC080610-09]ALL85626.1 hypothetical protein AD017_31660 [Pseudonocardia sp. EC080619-01]